MQPILSVSDFLKLSNEVLHQNIQSGAFAVEGEISGFSVKDGKWLIFCLKDETEANVKVKCFTTVYKVQGTFEDGMRVRVWGGPSVKAWSDFQLDVERMEPVGEGALKRAYDLLKKRLQQEGLFATSRKRALPKFPQCIGLITSSDAAAYGDFLRILNNRWGGVQVIHADVRVQGKEAVTEIISALANFSDLPIDQRPDVVVLTRGGGSLEDLHAFNDERVVRAVYGSLIPVVCGVGHERDESLCDFVADVRASTPSNAAERVVPDRREVEYTVQMMVERVCDRFHRTLDDQRYKIETANRVFTQVMERRQTQVDGVVQRLFLRSSTWMGNLRNRLEGEERLLRNVDPTRVLGRGYSIVTSAGKIIKEAAALSVGAEIEVTFARGTRDAKIIN